MLLQTDFHHLPRAVSHWPMRSADRICRAMRDGRSRASWAAPLPPSPDQRVAEFHLTPKGGLPMKIQRSLARVVFATAVSLALGFGAAQAVAAPPTPASA